MNRLLLLSIVLIRSSCLNCGIFCLTCEGEANNCTSCNGSQFLTLVGNDCNCMDGHFKKANSCDDCHYSCQTCSDKDIDKCLTCNTTQRSLANNVCFCLPGTYDNTTNQMCDPCHYSCEECMGDQFDKCILCDLNDHRIKPDFSTPNECICEDGYFDNGTTLCETCHYSCLTCEQQHNRCLTCDQPSSFRSLVLTSCLCITHYFDAGINQCSVCSARCENCTGSAENCLTCPINRVLSGNTCVCIDGYYENSATITCQPCTDYCLTCQNSSSTCLSCQTSVNRQLYNATCSCVSGYYDIGTIICKQCPSSCEECFGPLPTCTLCPSNSSRQLKSGACTCLDGYYDSGSDPVCQPCDYTCKTCISEFQCNVCDSALHRTLLATDCPCDVGYYDDGYTPLCQPCHHSCYSCFGPAENQCYTCRVNRDYDSYSCPCQAGLYQFNQLCFPCDMICLTCSGSDNICTSCPESRRLVGTTCVCQDGYYASSSSCLSCSPECLTCQTVASNCLSCNPLHFTDLISNSCLCPQGLYKNPLTYICQSCDIKCLACTDLDDCLSCNSSLQRTLSGGQCPCNAGFYDGGSAECFPCHTHCLECVGGSDYNCTSCSSGYHLVGSYCRFTMICNNYLYEDKCINECPLWTYPNNNLCQRCPDGCSTCVSNSFCLACDSGYFYNSTSGDCSLTCLPGDYLASVGQCRNCPTGCSKCVQLNFQELICYQCQVGYILEIGKECVLVCDSGYVLSNQVCVQCPAYCSRCSAFSASNCIDCQGGAFLLGSTCYKTCPAGYYASSSKCESCPIQCSTCLLNQCLSCASDYYLNSDSICTPNGYFYKKGQLTHCHPNCISCTDRSFSSCIGCSNHRGDYSSMAISGYCDCKSGSIDTGDGGCDTETYKAIQLANQALIGSTYSTLCFSILSSFISANLIPTFFLVNYLQVYSSFYYVNSSAVMQTDTILAAYQKVNLNTNYRHHSSSRLLLSTQTDASLFMRGQSVQNLSEWGLPVLITNLFIWGILLILRFCSCCCCRGNQVMNLEVKAKRGYLCKYPLNYYIKILRSYIDEGAAIIVFLVTYCEIFTYGFASFKIMISEGSSLNSIPSVISIIFLSYYAGYLIRLLVGCSCQAVSHMNSRPHHLWILFHQYQQSAKSRLHALFMPLLVLRNILIIGCIVVLSNRPKFQIGIALCILGTSFLGNFFICPWPNTIRFWFHFHEIVLVSQTIIFLYLTTIPEASRIRPSIMIIGLNFLQIAIVIGMIMTVVVVVLKGNFCKKQSQTAKDQSQKAEPQVPHNESLSDLLPEKKDPIENINEYDQGEQRMQVKRYRVIRK